MLHITHEHAEVPVFTGVVACRPVSLHTCITDVMLGVRAGAMIDRMTLDHAR